LKVKIEIVKFEKCLEEFDFVNNEILHNNLANRLQYFHYLYNLVNLLKVSKNVKHSFIQNYIECGGSIIEALLHNFIQVIIAKKLFTVVDLFRKVDTFKM